MTNATFIGKTPWGTERWAYKAEDVAPMTMALTKIWDKATETKKGRRRR